MRIGVVTAYPKSDWHSARLIDEIRARGAEAKVIDPASFSLEDGAAGLRLLADGRDLLSLDALLLARGMSPRGDGDIQFEVYRQLRAYGQPQVNAIGALLTAQDKVRTSCLLARAGVATPPTAVIQAADRARAALARMGTAVIKPRFGSLGSGVARVRDDRRGRAALVETLAREGAVYLQRYVEGGGEDYRVFVVAGRARAAIRRRARRNEWRTNMALGGSVEPYESPVAMRRLAQAATRAVGLDYTAVDLVVDASGPQVLEVNGHPNFEGIWRAMGRDMAVFIVDLVLRRAQAFRQKGRAVGLRRALRRVEVEVLQSRVGAAAQAIGARAQGGDAVVHG